MLFRFNISVLQQLRVASSRPIALPMHLNIHCLESFNVTTGSRRWLIDSQHFFCLGVRTSPQELLVSHGKSCQHVYVGVFRVLHFEVLIYLLNCNKLERIEMVRFSLYPVISVVSWLELVVCRPKLNSIMPRPHHTWPPGHSMSHES